MIFISQLIELLVEILLHKLWTIALQKLIWFLQRIDLNLQFFFFSTLFLDLSLVLVAFLMEDEIVFLQLRVLIHDSWRDSTLAHHLRLFTGLDWSLAKWILMFWFENICGYARARVMVIYVLAIIWWRSVQVDDTLLGLLILTQIKPFFGILKRYSFCKFLLFLSPK